LKVHCLLEAMEQQAGEKASGRRFPRQEKRRMKELSCAVSLDFVSLRRRGLLEECVHPRFGRGWVGWGVSHQ